MAIQTERTPLIEPVPNIEESYDFTPSTIEMEVVRDVVHKFRYCADERNRAFNYFDGRNLIDYINDSVRRFTTNVDQRDGLEDWQARVHDPFTRNKVLAILGKISSILPIAAFMPQGDDDPRKASLMSDLYRFSEDRDDYEEFMTNYLLEAIVKGTSVGYEGMEYHERNRRTVSGNPDDTKIENKVIKQTKLFAEMVPLEEFYPSNVGIRTIKDMPYCFWRREYSFLQFRAMWDGYEKTKYVRPHSPAIRAERRPFYADFISNSVVPGNVEVIRFYDQVKDLYIIIANGVWLNPVTDNTYEEPQEAIAPLPFNHKKLPFFDVKFDFFGNWFYGKSLPDRLKSLQDVLNVLTNMLLDQSFLTIFPPLLTAGSDGIEDDYLRPGRRTPVDTQGLPIQQSYVKLDLGTPQGWHEFILNYTRKVMEETSIDSVSSGRAGVGGRTTATEINTAADGVASMLGTFGLMINHALKQKAQLRAANILQFWTDPKTPYITGVLGDNGDKELEKAFNLFKVDNTTLSHGKRGTRVLAMYGDQADMPSPIALKAKAAITKASTGKDVEYMAINADYIQNMDFNVKVVMDQRRESTKDVEKALQLEKVRVYMTFFPQQVDVNELAAQTAEKMGDDPTKVLKQEILHPQPAQPGQGVPGQPPQQVSQTPQMNPSQQLTDTGTQGFAGGAQGLSQMLG